MVEKKRKYFGLLLLVIVVVTIIHSTSYIMSNYSINTNKTSSVSGLVVENPESQKTGLFSSLPQFLLIFEWVIVIFGTTFFVLKRQVDLRKEVVNLYLTKKYYSLDKPQTDLDVLYEILKERKQIKIASVSKVFHVTKETAMSWAKILEGGNLASLYYPQFGDPELMLIE